MGDALIRELSLDRDMYDTGFTISFCRGLLTAAVIAVGAWPVAAFFGDPRLRTITLVFRRFHVRVADLWHGVWRPLLATAAMAGVLVWQGLGWTALPGSPLVIGEQLVLAVAVGAITYCAVIVLLWWLAGRPEGAEMLTWRLAKRSMRRQPA